MKKSRLFLTLSVVVLIFLITGCENNTVSPPVSESVSDTTASAPDTVTEAPENDTEAPVIVIDEAKREVSVKYGEEIDLLDGVTVTDNRDNDIKIEINGKVDTHTVGTYKVGFTAEDAAGNRAAEVTKTVRVLWNSPLSFIGHAGCYYGIMNTEEAFVNAAGLGYQAIECDVKQTSDGVFVVCHDNEFAGSALASTTYDNLKSLKNTVTRGGKSYTSSICTFGRYLEICRQYNMKAVVELKSSKGITNADQSRMSALMAEIKQYNMLDSVIFLGSQYNCLIWVKQNGYADIPCQYLVNSIESADTLNRCIEYGLDISFNISNNNSAEWIQRYHDNGIRVACYTFSQYQDAAELQKWIDLGVDYVTCDKLVAADVKLPEYGTDEPKKTYTVRFVDSDGAELKKITVNDGAMAVAPVDPEKAGYTFIGWDTDTSVVRKNTVVTAKYEKTQFSITYYGNCVEFTGEQWTDKAAFLNEFYNDYFNWLSANADRISSLSKSGDEYTMKLNDTTVKFKSAADIAAVDIYVFEKTLSNYIYAPVKRANDTTPVEPAENSAYFLNTSPYRVKYRSLDAYFLGAAINGYPAYDRTYTPTSTGKIQIFFRFQQWAKGTAIPSFDTLPVKTVVKNIEGVTVTLPTAPITFTVDDEITLPDATVAGGSFAGWYTAPECNGEKIIKFEKGTVRDIVLYAKIIRAS